MLASYAPRAYAYMKPRLQAVFERLGFALNFANSVYPAMTMNFGPSTVCHPHLDVANDPCNWCHITALGRFDPKKGGHLILFDLKIAIEFPPGASILIPSALLRHGNVPIQPGETRLSFTQYCAGSLLQWADCGFRTYQEFQAQEPEGFARYEAGLGDRVQECVRLFSLSSELENDRMLLKLGLL